MNVAQPTRARSRSRWKQNPRSTTPCAYTWRRTSHGYCTRTRTTLASNHAPGAHIAERVHVENAYFQGHSPTCTGHWRTATLPSQSDLTCRPSRRQRRLRFLHARSDRSSHPVISYFQFWRPLPHSNTRTQQSHGKPDSRSTTPGLYTCSRCRLQQFATAPHRVHGGHIGAR